MRSEPVLLVHGFATNSARTWGETGMLDLLGDAGREVIAVDLLGHGEADKPHDPAAYEHLEDDVLARLPDGPVDAVGFSMGARIVLTLASRHPERFSRIVVAGVGANLFQNEGGEYIAEAVEGRAAEDNPVAQHIAPLAQVPPNDPAALAACMRRKAEPLTAEQLANVKVPVLVALGDQDFAGPADPLMDALPDARLVTLKGTDHFATPKSFAFIDAVLEVLDALP
jgi:pimeloyl-ACP methyl ester carboxylesterase